LIALNGIHIFKSGGGKPPPLPLLCEIELVKGMLRVKLPQRAEPDAESVILSQMIRLVLFQYQLAITVLVPVLKQNYSSSCSSGTITLVPIPVLEPYTLGLQF